MSAFGGKAGIAIALRNVRFGSKADICAAISHVRFAPNSGHVQRNSLGGVFKRLDFALLELKVVHLSISQGSFEPDRVTKMSLAVFDD
jgi:hypothetical protein